MRSTFFVALITIFTPFSQAANFLSLPAKQTLQDNPDIQKTSTYAIAPMNRVNWVYLGFVPRATDPRRTTITISKVGYTLRVTFTMTEQEVADYPQYLINRADALNTIFSQRGLSVTQPVIWANYQDRIERIRRSRIGSYKAGINLLKEFFPKNIMEFKKPAADGVKAIAIFVYPITVYKGNDSIPADDTYHVYNLEERRDRHCDEMITNEDGTRVCAKEWDYIFGGFPALWFSDQIGIHGPIRYDYANKKINGESIVKIWRDNEPGNFGYDKMVGINPSYRTDLVRQKNSKGCIRSESMEIRHLLPASPDAVKRVPIKVISEWDKLLFEDKERIVNVEYYMVDVGQFKKLLGKDQWFKREAPEMISRFPEMINFPYLDPSAVEFKNASGEADLTSMRLLNRAPYHNQK